jgi:hypothetical protein
MDVDIEGPLPLANQLFRGLWNTNQTLDLVGGPFLDSLCLLEATLSTTRSFVWVITQKIYYFPV